ncbi:MAG: hypothetical protein R3F49_04135 [Planctomycetota bacterium]
MLASLAVAAADAPAGPRPDLIVLDPPRVGLHPKVAPAVLALAAPRIVYVSCNPDSAARDLAQLLAGGYALERVRPVDLFPHTPHIETVISLRWIGAPDAATPHEAAPHEAAPHEATPDAIEAAP